MSTSSAKQEAKTLDIVYLEDDDGVYKGTEALLKSNGLEVTRRLRNIEELESLLKEIADGIVAVRCLIAENLIGPTWALQPSFYKIVIAMLLAAEENRRLAITRVIALTSCEPYEHAVDSLKRTCAQANPPHDFKYLGKTWAATEHRALAENLREALSAQGT